MQSIIKDNICPCVMRQLDRHCLFSTTLLSNTDLKQEEAEGRGLQVPISADFK